MGAVGTGIWREEAATGVVAMVVPGAEIAEGAESCCDTKTRVAATAVARVRVRTAARLRRPVRRGVDERGGGYMRLLSGGATVRVPEGWSVFRTLIGKSNEGAR